LHRIEVIRHRQPDIPSRSRSRHGQSTKHKAATLKNRYCLDRRRLQ
jgi:hypothetical protein